VVASETMLIQAYRVVSRRPGSIEAIRIRVLAKHTLTAHHQAIGIDTWKAELISIEDDHLGTPFAENSTEGYRIWLPS